MELAYCTKCNKLMEDENPEINQFDCDESKIAHLDLVDMTKVKEGSWSYWACPVCEEDGNLVDVSEYNFATLLEDNNQAP